jgi:hypothetical protein
MGNSIGKGKNAQTLGDLPHLRTTKMPLIVKLKAKPRLPLAVLTTANQEMSPLFVQVRELHLNEESIYHIISYYFISYIIYIQCALE